MKVGNFPHCAQAKNTSWFNNSSSSSFSSSFPSFVISVQLPAVFLWFKWVCNRLYYFHYSIYLANNIFVMKVTNWRGSLRTSWLNISWVVNSVCVIRWNVLFALAQSLCCCFIFNWTEFKTRSEAAGWFSVQITQAQKGATGIPLG